MRTDRAFETLTDELMHFSSLGIRPGTGRISRLLSCLGNPERSFRAVHVLGTNGKGSSAAMIESILAASGRKTALYTSPHLVSLQERLRIDKAPLASRCWRDAFETLCGAVTQDAELASNRPTFFENLTALAFLLIAREKVDIAIIEAGMGGRYDATSLCQPLATFITPIGMDHMEYLGTTLPQIAAEKFAAVKTDIPAFYAADDETLALQFADTCAAQSAPHYLLDRLAEPRDVAVDLHDGTTFSYCARDLCAEHLKTPLIGVHQAENAARVVSFFAEMRRLAPFFSEIDDRAIRDGLAATSWPGRFETLEIPGTKRFAILDGAHNAHGMRALVGTLRMLENTGEIDGIAGYVLAAMQDKDLQPILAEMKCYPHPIYCTQVPDTARSHTAHALAATLRSAGWDVAGIFQHPADAVQAAIRETDAAHPVVCCGSLFLIGHLRGIFADV